MYRRLCLRKRPALRSLPEATANMGMSLAYGHFLKCLQFGVLACYIHEPVGSIFSSELGPQSDRFFFLTTDLVGLMDGNYIYTLHVAGRAWVGS